MRTLGLWVFPHSSRHPQATAAGIGRKGGSWVRIQGQVRQGVRNPGRWRWELICKIGSVLSKCFRRFRNCRYPLKVSPKTPLGLQGSSQMPRPYAEFMRMVVGGRPLARGPPPLGAPYPGIRIALGGAGCGNWRRQRSWMVGRFARKVARLRMGLPTTKSFLAF